MSTDNLSKSFSIQGETVETSQDFLKYHFSQIRFQKGQRKKRQMAFPRVWERCLQDFLFFSLQIFHSSVWRKECYDSNNKLLLYRQLVWDFVWIWNCGQAFCCWWFVGSYHLTWGHSWVVFGQHPMLQKGSSESEAGHLPWLSCWWRRCSPASRVLSFPSFYFRCKNTNRPAAAGFILLKNCGGAMREKRSQSKVAAHEPIEKKEPASENGSHAHTKWSRQLPI